MSIIGIRRFDAECIKAEIAARVARNMEILKFRSGNGFGITECQRQVHVGFPDVAPELQDEYAC